jgi:large subunit ribosomal protein L22
MASAKAILRNNPTSPRKARYVADLVRGMDVEKAINTLHYSTKHPARVIEKLLISAVNNWKQANEGAREEDSALYVKEIFVDGGTTIKRFLPAPHGRAYKMRKRSNHITIVVDSRTGAGSISASADAEVTEVTPEETPAEAPVKKARKAPAKKAAAKKSTTKKTNEE